MLTFAEALKQMFTTLRAAGYPGARIEVHISLPDVDAAQREETVARAIIEQSLHPKPTFDEAPPRRLSRPLGIVNGVFVYTNEEY